MAHSLTDPQVRAPEFPVGLHWLNTPAPLSVKSLQGKVILLDFWTFCCINCMHILPDLAFLEEKYPDTLTVIGVHSAKFSNEGETEQIGKAINRYGIRHPVVNDHEFHVWNAYGANSWPTFALIDPEGYLVGMTSGEGKREVLDQAIDTLLTHHKNKGTLIPRPSPAPASGRNGGLLHFPGKLDLSPNHQILVSDSGHHRFLLLDWNESDPSNARLCMRIGGEDPGFEDGDFETARFRDPQGVRFEPGNPEIAYVTDTGNHALRILDFRSRTVRTVAGTGVQGWALFEPKTARGALLNSPWDLVFLKGWIYIAMAGPHQIIAYDPLKGTLIPMAGSAREDLVDGPGDRAALAQPSGITTDGTSLYFADSETSSIRTLLPGQTSSSSQVRTLVGKGLFEFGNRDGSFENARLQHPLGILWDDGLLLVADTYNHRIRALDPTKREVVSLTEGQGLDEPSDIKKGGSVYLITNTNRHGLSLLCPSPDGPVLSPLTIDP
ncbi:MAG: thioredoxin-like domain-containing protein [Leptospirales bacterium]